jgi:predicted dinucleotide-binding enzyme
MPTGTLTVRPSSGAMHPPSSLSTWAPTEHSDSAMPDGAQAAVSSALEAPRETTGSPLVEAAPPPRLQRIAVLGTGHSGPVIARAAVAAGYEVSIAASGDPENIALIAQVLVPGAEPRWAADAVKNSDIVVLALPLHKFATLDPILVADKIVIDAMNYWPPTDGVQEMFEDHQRGSSEIVADRLSLSTIVKTLNHIGYHDLEDQRRPVGSPERRALGVAGDDTGAVDAVAELIERIGYDAVRLDSLRAGRLLQPGGPVFGASLCRAEFEMAVRGEPRGALPHKLAETQSRQGALR